MPHSSLRNLRAIAIALSLACVCCLPPASLADQNEAISLNNAGVKALNQANFPLAIKYFETSLEKDINYSLVRENLAITYENYGRSLLKSNRAKALFNFYRAFLVREERSSTAEVKNVLTQMGQANKTSRDHVRLAHAAERRGDLIGSFVELSQALRLEPKEIEIRAMLSTTLRKLEEKKLFPYSEFAKTEADRWFGIKSKPSAISRTPEKNSASTGAPDFTPVMQEIQRRIKRNWFPPRDSASRQAVVIFKIAKDGSVSDIRIDKTSGVDAVDKAALKAVSEAAPFPIGRPHSDWLPIDIQFTFDYNVFARNATAKLASDLESAPPGDQEMGALQASELALQSVMLKYAESFEKFGKFDAALRMYERLLHARKYEHAKDYGQIESLNRSIELVKLLNTTSNCEQPDALEPLVIDCLGRIELDTTLAQASRIALRKRLAHLIFQRRADAVGLAESVSKSASLSLVTKQEFIENLHNDATIDFYTPRYATTLGQMNLAFKKKLEDIDEANHYSNMASKYELSERYVLALDGYKKAFALREKSIGETDGDTLALKGDIARMLVKLGKLKESQDSYKETVTAFKKYGETDYRYIRFLESYGDALSQAKVEPLASEVYSQAVEAWKKSNTK